MKRNITRLGGLMILALMSLPLMGQNEGKAVHAIHGVEQRYVPEQGVQLRSETPRDSAIRYNSAGQKTNKYVYSDDSSRGTYQWENNTWVFVDSDPEEWRWNSFKFDWQNRQEKVSYGIFADRLIFSIPAGLSSNTYAWSRPADIKFNTAYDKNGNLISFELVDLAKYSIKYNTFNKPVSMELYYGETFACKANWEYNAAGFATFFEVYEWDEARYKEVDTYDAKGNLISIETYEGNSTNNWVEAGLKRNYKWDDRNRRISQEIINYISTTRSRTDYEWDDKGREKKLSEYSWSANEWILARYYICYYAGDENSNAVIQTLEPAVYLHDGILTVRSDRAEQITVYSVSGARLYEGRTQAGTTTIATTRFPQGVLIVKGNGWVRKIRN